MIWTDHKGPRREYRAPDFKWTAKKQILQLELSIAKSVSKETAFSKAAVSAFRSCTDPVVYIYKIAIFCTHLLIE